MKVNVEKSLELKKKYRHRINHCYNNAYRLLMNDEIDKIVHGYCSDDNKVFIRHAWGIKDGEIIDSTFRKDELKDNNYLEMFELNRKEFFQAMRETTGSHLLEYKIEEQEAFIDNLREKYGLIKIC